MKLIANKQLKYNQARLAILDLMATREMVPGDCLPSQCELAKLLPFGEITIRHALKDLEQSGLVVRKPGCGTFLTKQLGRLECHSKILLVTVALKGAKSYGHGFAFTQDYLAARGITLVQMRVTEFTMEVRMAAKECIGIITNGWLNEEFLGQLKTLNLPIVIQGNSRLTAGLPMVSKDLEAAAYRLTRIFGEDGRRHIALFRGSEAYYPAQQAERGYLHAMEELSLPPLILQVNESAGLHSVLDKFMREHLDIDGILMEHFLFFDYSSWAWQHGYSGHPAMGFLSTEPFYKCYHQSRNFLWVRFENTMLVAARLLVHHVMTGEPMSSVCLEPTIPSLDDDEDFFFN